MPQEWEYGNAAKQPAYDESASQNPFAPVDYAARLQNPPARQQRPQQTRTYVPPVPSAPPMPAPGYGQPQYMQQPAQYMQQPAQYTPPQYMQQPAQPVQSYPAQGSAGAPYSAALFDHQPTAVMPSGWEQTPFADRTAIDFWNDPPAQQPAYQPAAPQPEPEPAPAYYSAADIPLRDPFTPAKPREDDKKQETPVQEKQPEKKRAERGRIRIGRLMALICAGVMLIICTLAGGQMIAELVRTERESDAREANGMYGYEDASKVELPPAGQTFAPTEIPVTAAPAHTPVPTPVIPVNESVIPGMSSLDSVEAGETADASVPAKRSRLTSYPKNPMRNITESLRAMVAENSDVIGRLVIEGVLDEMVMQRNNTYYLTHNASGVTSESGAVFADQSCVLRNPPENLLLRGQSGVPGKVFAPLWQYVSGGSQFAASNMYARFTSLYEDELYVLISVMVVDINPAGSRYFNYASNPTFTTDEAMLTYVQNARSRSLYNFHVDVQPTDRLLTVATLGSGESNLVLLYRMVRDNEYGAQ